MATPEIVDLLLSSGDFARLSTTEQRNRLVTYYQPWFLGEFKIDTVNNIRATQRLTTHAKALNAPVGVVLLVILEEASRPTARAPQHGLLDVEAGHADTRSDEESQGNDMTLYVGLVESPLTEDAPEMSQEPTPTRTPPTPPRGRRQTRSKGPPRAR